MRLVRFVAALTIGTWVCTAALAAQDGTTGGQWRSYSGDAGSTKYAPLDQINKDNVRNLRILWRRPAVDPTLTAKSPGLRVAPNFRATFRELDTCLQCRSWTDCTINMFAFEFPTRTPGAPATAALRHRKKINDRMSPLKS